MAMVSALYLLITYSEFSSISQLDSATVAIIRCQCLGIFGSRSRMKKNKKPCRRWVKLYGSNKCWEVWELQVLLAKSMPPQMQVSGLPCE